jgi:hypothetical protein
MVLKLAHHLYPYGITKCYSNSVVRDYYYSFALQFSQIVMNGLVNSWPGK